MKKSEKTKFKIMQVAVEFFYKNGFDNTTTKEIAKQAGISEATIFKYFSTKKNLLIQSLIFLSNTEKLDLLFTPIEELILLHKNDSIENLLIAIVKNRRDLFHKNFKYITIILTESRNHPEILPIFQEKLYPRFYKIGKKIFELGITNGEINENINIDIVLRSWIGSVFFMFLDNKLLPQLNNQLDSDKEIKQLVHNFLFGIRKES